MSDREYVIVVGLNRRPQPREKSMVDYSLLQLHDALEADNWRVVSPFSQETEDCNRRLFADASDENAAGLLSEWLAEFQPCLFGRFAAKQRQLTFCFIRPRDLQKGDACVQDLIQSARLKWTAAGFRGLSSGFVVVLLSEHVSKAIPDQRTQLLAQGICEKYLLEPIATDEIYLDELFLEVPTSPVSAWRWVTGVNYFSSQADGRWWRDHRIPGGMAFSVNSVGHMARSGRLHAAMKDFGATMGIALDDVRAPVDSLEKALRIAMMTIDRAADTASGRSTELLPLPADVSQLPVHPCPIELSGELKTRNYCEYSGYYHTDVTLPSLYFRPDVTRPEEAAPLKLDFTYLFDKRLDNPDYLRMGTGVRIRETDSALRHVEKRRRVTEERLMIAQSPRLTSALSQAGR